MFDITVKVARFNADTKAVGSVAATVTQTNYYVGALTGYAFSLTGTLEAGTLYAIIVSGPPGNDLLWGVTYSAVTPATGWAVTRRALSTASTDFDTVDTSGYYMFKLEIR